jgi:hypothetical protein
MKFSILFFLLIPLTLFAQIHEDFEHSLQEIWLQNKNLRWDTSSYKPLNGKYSLRHIYDNPYAGHDQISFSHKALLLDSATTAWQFKIKHGYNPSSSNSWGVFIVSDKNALYMFPGENISGYVLGVNLTGYDDLVKLWKVSSGSIYTIATTNFNWQENIGIEKAAEFEITRNKEGTWTIKLDTSSGSTIPFLLGTAQDSEFNYSLFFGIYYKYSAQQDQKLWFDDLTINGCLYNDSAGFLSYDAKPRDVLITEIMADPKPPVLLPEYEYIELYNKSNYNIRLSDWRITIGNSTARLPFSIIKSKEYIIITESGNDFGPVNMKNILYVNALPVLNNSGQTISLKNNKNSLIHSVNYSGKWYSTDYKAEGGWSLEMIDANNPCGRQENWAESIDYKGGTPGQVNSVTGFNPDNLKPVLERAAIISDSSIKIYFNEPLDSISLTDNQNYFIDHNIGYATAIFPEIPHLQTVKLQFNDYFKNNTTYTISIGNKIKDCAGNALENNSQAIFAIPEKADSLDLIINEVLFNPGENGEDFVEIYNRCKKILDIRYYNIASRESFSNKFKDCFPVIKEHYLIFPGEYVLLTANRDVIQQKYTNINHNCLIELLNMPSLPDDEGIVVITDNQLNILDEFAYSEDMHFELLNSCEGVSLERISSQRPTNDINNWHSASEAFNFATPGYRNSQCKNFEPVADRIFVEPEIFSPDNDGYNDFVSILYNFNDPGCLANITIFDAKGRTVKRLVRNTLLGTEGSFIWNGINEENRKAGAGIYLIYTEIFDLNGNTHKFKNSCVLASKINY